MAIDFASKANRYTYSDREADRGWADAIRAIVDPSGKDVVDIGCGGGIYSTAFSDLGATSVIGVDSSAEMIGAARERAVGHDTVTFRIGNAASTGLAAGAADIVFARALVHHLGDPAACFLEAKRLLRASGVFVVQDRLWEDVAVAGSPDHIRGYFFEKFPALLDVERRRRPTSETILGALESAGFSAVDTTRIAEKRRDYGQFSELRQDLLARSGRSILHELTDTQLHELAAYIEGKLDPHAEITDVDHWTIWTAR